MLPTISNLYRAESRTAGARFRFPEGNLGLCTLFTLRGGVNGLYRTTRMRVVCLRGLKPARSEEGVWGLVPRQGLGQSPQMPRVLLDCPIKEKRLLKAQKYGIME